MKRQLRLGTTIWSVYIYQIFPWMRRSLNKEAEEFKNQLPVTSNSSTPTHNDLFATSATLQTEYYTNFRKRRSYCSQSDTRRDHFRLSCGNAMFLRILLLSSVQISCNRLTNPEHCCILVRPYDSNYGKHSGLDNTPSVTTHSNSTEVSVSGHRVSDDDESH